jgi:hypothetical protein
MNPSLWLGLLGASRAADRDAGAASEANASPVRPARVESGWRRLARGAARRLRSPVSRGPAAAPPPRVDDATTAP